MRKVTLRSLWAHKRRLLATVVTIVLGVTFMSGTFILSTTLDRAFDDLFGEAVEEVDVLVQGEILFEDPQIGDQRGNVPAGLARDLDDVLGVRDAEARVTTSGATSFNRLLDPDGESIGSVRADTLLESWIEEADLSPYELADGRVPEGPRELVLNVAAVEDASLSIGDPITVVSKAGPEEFELVGTFTFGAAKSAAGAITAAFTLEEAQRLAGLDGEVTSIYVSGDTDLTQEELLERIALDLPGGVEAITGDAAVAQLSEASQVESGVEFMGVLLTIFGVIALIVGTFVISNTFTILVAQRTRELALLRALGASRAQVLGSVLLEAAVIGAVASAVGIGVGMLLSEGVAALLSAGGASLPTRSLIVEPDTIVISLFVGVVVTLLAALVPGLRATRVPPLAALRDVAVDRSGVSRWRVGTGVLCLLAGAVNLSAAWRSDDSGTIPAVGVGAGLAVVGFLVVGPVVSGRSVRVLGLPVRRYRGVTGKLAMLNAARSPRRTSATASAIVIGVMLVVLVTIFAASATSTVSTEVDRAFLGDFAVAPEPQGLEFSGGMPLTLVDAIGEVDGVDVVSPIAMAGVELAYPDGERGTHFASAVDVETFPDLFRPRMVVGAPEELSERGIVVRRTIAEDHDLRLGDEITVTAPGGASRDFVLEGVSDDLNLVGQVTVRRDVLARMAPQLVDAQVSGTVVDGEDVADVLADVETVVADVPNLDVLDRKGVTGTIVDQVNAGLSLVWALLLLSIVTALVGVANTLSLSITERIRELGLFRAVGMDRNAVRASVRWEAALVAVLGALVGLLLGLIVSVALMRSLRALGLATTAVPALWLLVIVVATGLLGTLAAIRPGRRASSLPVLDAIATD